MRKILKNKKGDTHFAWFLIGAVLMIFLLFVLYPKVIGPWLTKIFKGSGPMDDKTYQDTDKSFNLLTNNIQACNAVDDENCICKGWPNFPGIFHPDTILTINNPSKKISLSVSTRDVWDTTFENVFEYFSLGLVKKDQTVYVYSLGSNQNYQTNSFSTINMTFTKIPEIEAKDGAAGKYGIVSSEYFFKKNLKQNGLPILEIITRAGREDLTVLNSEISGLPACSDKRTLAIASFRKMTNAISSASSGQDYAINDLPDGYSILLRKADNSIMLIYNNQVVREVSFVNDIISANNLWGWIGISKVNIMRLEIKDVSFETASLCSDLQKTELNNGEKIKFKSEAGKACVFAA
jgi:hypothetical protein